jgi:hypothetical protein
VRALAVLFALIGPSFALAGTGPFMRFNGGGPSRTDCMLVTEVAGASGVHTAQCFDGDPACDDDGAVDGGCVFRVRLCLDAVDPAQPRCQADVVTQVQSAVPDLETALTALAMPVASPDTCTATVPLRVARRGARGRLVIRARARMSSGHADADRVTLVCRRPPHSTTTFETLQRKIFTPSCALPSCHGAAGAGGLMLGAGIAYGNLIGVPATNMAAHAAGLLRVAPGDPDGSFLIRKLEGALTADEGTPMPQAGSRLPQDRIDLLRRWISAGAPADAPF